MAEDLEKSRTVLENRMLCPACGEKALHIVVFRDREKVTIECGFCGFRSNKTRRQRKPAGCKQPVQYCKDCKIEPCELWRQIQ